MGLIKTSLDSTTGHSFGMFQQRPICIAIRFDKKPEICDGIIKIGETLRLYVSSTDKALATNIYNGLLKIKNFTIFESAVTNPRFVYLNEYKFYQRRAKMFYTLSPVVIRNCHDKSKYVTPSDDNFVESFENGLKDQWHLYHDSKLENIKCQIIKYRKTAMTHYGGLVLGFTGLFTLEADPDVLEFFYQAGFGYRRSNGFGFVEADR